MTQYRFTLPSSSGNDFDSAEHLPLIVYFYPKDSTPGCTTEGLDFNALLPRFEALDATILGVSRDSVKERVGPGKSSSLRVRRRSPPKASACASVSERAAATASSAADARSSA